MSKQGGVRQTAAAPGLTRSPASLLARRSTLGQHVTVQRVAASPAAIHPSAPSLVRDVVDSPGQPLDASARAALEPRFGHDFSQVRVHDDQRAATSARAVNANAYTAGRHVVFGAGQYAPTTPVGQRLLTHELTHVVQQAHGPVAGTPVGSGMSVSHPGDPFERDATATAQDRVSRPTQYLAAAERTRPESGDLYLQRDGTDTALAAVGAVAGIAALGVGIAALVYAIKQTNVAQHPPASASPTGGITLGNATFNTLGPPPVAEGSNDETLRGARTRNIPCLYVDAPHTQNQANNFTVGLQTKTDGHNIVDAFTEEQHVEGYRGGGDGATLQISFSPVPVPRLGPAPPPATAPVTMGTPNAGGGADTPPPTPPPPQAASSEPAEALLRFTGINGAKGEIQRFKGAYRIKGNGDVVTERSECKVTEGDPASMNIADYGYISVGLGRTPSPQPVEPTPPTPTPQHTPPAAGGGGSQ